MTVEEVVATNLNEENRHIWSSNAEAWDAVQGEGGNDFQNQHVYPATEKLLGLPTMHYEEVLELGCGNGVFARRLAAYGAADRILATDFSEVQLEFARRRTPKLQNAETGSIIEYSLLDATDEEGIKALGRHRFDCAVSTMVLMDMPDPEAMFRGLRHVLKPGGCVVVSVMHPAFNTEVTRGFEKEVDKRSGKLETQAYLKVDKYLTSGLSKGKAVQEQPELQFYWHRPLHVLMGHMFAAGFVVDGFEEPAVAPPDPETLPPPKSQDDALRRFMWYQFTEEFPFTVVIRARPKPE